MAISLVSVEVSELVKIISVSDSAINWDLSVPNAIPEDDENVEDAKKRVYSEERDISSLVFKPDDLPTYFIFKNPKTLENSKAISNVQLSVAGVGSGKKKRDASDLWFVTFDSLLIGTASDPMSEPTPIPRDKHSKQIEKRCLEALVSQGVVSEMAGVLLGMTRATSSKKNN